MPAPLTREALAVEAIRRLRANPDPLLEDALTEAAHRACRVAQLDFRALYRAWERRERLRTAR